MRQLPFKRLAMLLGFFALFMFGILIMDGLQIFAPLRSGLAVVMNPVITEMKSIGGSRAPETPLEIQLATAVAERDALLAENMLLQGQLDEQEVLLQTLKIQSDFTDRQVLPARVLGTDPSGLQQKIIINRGTTDGIRVGMAVTDGTHFVGQVTTVEEHRSTVLLITDAKASVGARMYASRVDGILYGNGRLNQTLTLRHINRNVEPEENEWIMTSDLFESETAQVPGNIPIGWIIGEPRVNAQTDELEFTVEPAADMGNLENVWIVVPHD